MANQFGLGFDSTKKQKEDKPTNPTIQTRGIGSLSPLSPTPIYDATTNAIAGAMKILPVEARTWLRGVVPPLVDTVLGNPTPPSEKQYPIGGENFTNSDVKNIDAAVSSAMTRPNQKNKGLVGYGDYKYKKTQRNDDGSFQLSWDNPIAQSLGAFGYEVLPDGKIRVFDKYDSRNERTGPYLNMLNERKKIEHPLSVLWGELKSSFKERHLDAVKKTPSAYFKKLFTDPESLFLDLAQMIMNVVAENESTAKPIDFIYDPKTLEKYPTPIDSITGRRPKFGDMLKQNKKAEEVKKGAKNKNTKGKGKV